MTKYKDVKHIFDLFRSRDRKGLVIAGSAAVDLDKAGDIDLWSIKDYPSPGKFYRWMNDIVIDYVGADSPYKVLGHIYGKFIDKKTGKVVQMININPVMDIKESYKICDLFDLSCCMRSIDSKGKVYQSPEFTSPYGDREIEIVNYPIHENVRLRGSEIIHKQNRVDKMVGRYNVKLSDESKARLMMMRLLI